MVYSVCLRDGDAQTRAENVQWLTRSALQEAAVSTGVKKVCMLSASCVLVAPVQHVQQKKRTWLSLTDRVLKMQCTYLHNDWVYAEAT